LGREAIAELLADLLVRSEHCRAGRPIHARTGGNRSSTEKWRRR